MVGGTLVAIVAGKKDPGFVHSGPLAGLVAVCAGSNLMYLLGTLIAGGLFVVMFALTQNRWKVDDVLGVWPLHGLCGAWGGLGGPNQFSRSVLPIVYSHLSNADIYAVVLYCKFRLNLGHPDQRHVTY